MGETKKICHFFPSSVSTVPSTGHQQNTPHHQSEVTVVDDDVTDVSIIAVHVDHWEMRFKKLCLTENIPSPASDAFSSALDKEESSSSSPLLDPCSPWSFVPIVSSLKPSGARSSPLSVLFWEEQKNDLMIYSGSRNCSQSVANWISACPT